MISCTSIEKHCRREFDYQNHPARPADRSTLPLVKGRLTGIVSRGAASWPSGMLYQHKQKPLFFTRLR